MRDRNPGGGQGVIETAKSVPISLEQFPRLADQARNHRAE
jgi:hypothetical protein